MAYNTEPYLKDLQFRGYIEGLTVLDQSSKIPINHYFGGIPYALPPVGPFRWRKARALPPCYRYGTFNNPGRFNGGAGLCPQPGFGGLVPENREAWDEDCLQLNVWVPAGEQPEDGRYSLFV